MLLPTNRPGFGFPRNLPSLFDQMLETLPRWGAGLDGDQPTGFPAINAWGDEDNLHIEAEVPGVGIEDLQISVLGDELTIEGTRPERELQGAREHRRERRVGSFRRVLSLPVDVDADRIEATLENGVLSLLLPHAEAARPRAIEVRAN